MLVLGNYSKRHLPDRDDITALHLKTHDLPFVQQHVITGDEWSAPPVDHLRVQARSHGAAINARNSAQMIDD